MMQNLDKRLQGQEKKLEDSFSVMQKVSNKVVTLERQQAQGSKAHQLQCQTLNNGRPPNHNYGNNYFDQNKQNSHASTSNVNQSRALVPKKNMVQDQDFCPSCNYPYAHCMCQKFESYMALTIQEPAAGPSYKEDQFKDASYMQGQGDCSFMNHLVEEHCNVNQDSIAHNTRRKRRAMEDATPPPPNQAPTSNAIPHEQSANDQSKAIQ